MRSKEIYQERNKSMGMSASQARFLSLTARKNNVEFEGQQINQQRTTLSNESASYYAELCNMVVPTPPSIDDFTKVSYTFDDGALTNTITTMIAKENNRYSISYIQQWQDDYSIVSAASSIVSKSDNGRYKIGSSVLRQLGVGDGEATQITIDGTSYAIFNDDNGTYINEIKQVSEVVDCTQEDISNLEYYTYDSAGENITQVFKDSDGSFYTVDGSGNKTTLEDVTEDDLLICLYDDTQTDPDKAVLLVAPSSDSATGYVKETGNVITNTEKRYLTDSEITSVSSYTDPYLSTLPSEQVADLLEQENYYRRMLNEKVFNNPGSDQQWFVRYVKDSNTGSYVPYFYNWEQVTDDKKYDSNGFAVESIDCYSIGSSIKTKEVINALGSVEKDSTGRYISILLFQTDENGNIKKDDKGNEIYTQYSLVTNTTTDEDAYNDAMNKYNYEQYQYDQKIQDINSKIEIVQQQDKALELQLKQLDTEENAISTEMEAVKKVITKNIETSFKTFNA